MKAQMNWRFRAAILWVIFYLVLLIAQGCRPYPNQSKVIEVDKTKHATHR